MNWKKLMLIEMKQIQEAYSQLHTEETYSNDKLYETIWNKVNYHFKWFLIRMEQWLNGDVGQTPTGNELYNQCIKAQKIGEKSFYWNKISKKLYLEMKTQMEMN